MVLAIRFWFRADYCFTKKNPTLLKTILSLADI